MKTSPFEIHYMAAGDHQKIMSDFTRSKMIETGEKNQRSFFDFLIENLHLKSPVKLDSGPWGDLLTFDFQEHKSRRCFFVSLQALEDPTHVLSKLSDRVRFEDVILIAIPSFKYSALLKRRSWRNTLCEALDKNGFHVCDRFALTPDPMSPQIIFDLQRHMLTYVETISHRRGDHFLKIAAKKAIIAILGTISWDGWEILGLRKDKAGPFLPQIADRYLVLTPGREVALVFSSGRHLPVHVEKKGFLEDLKQEWQNHQWATRHLGPAAPSLLGFFPEAAQAVMKMEYVPEKNLPNMVSETFFRRSRLEKLTLAVFDFFLSVFTRFCDAADGCIGIPDTAMQAMTQKGLDFIPISGSRTSLRMHLEEVLLQNKFFLLPQHGDFCVRNVLFRNAEDMVLIDWEDFNPISLPLVDLNMLRISLAETWDQLGGSGDNFLQTPIIEHKISDLRQIIQKKLNLTDKDWQAYSLLSLAYLVGSNLTRNRMTTAGKIRDEFLRQVDSFDFK